MKKKYGQEGAVIIEAAIALPVFMFMMITLYSIIQIAYVQARMTIAVDAAAKELAQYAHVYFATGLNGSLSGSGGTSSQLANDVSQFLSIVGEGLGTVDSELGQFVSESGEALSGDSLVDIAKSGMGKNLGEQMMKKNLVNGEGDSAEAFMKRNRVKNLNMNGTKFLEQAGKEVFLRVNYDI
ncbi:MAG TPA: pilus assembly protein, partial [Candidatus Blautia intestinipullorum]|nr:pilus assembly protein [Candidatus Blautia intestinipullorum]